MSRLISKLLKRHSKATRTYSPVLRQIRGVDHRAYFKQQGLFKSAVMHKMYSDERKCTVMKSVFIIINYEETKNWYVRVSDGQNSFLDYRFLFKIENTILFSIFKILLKSIL